MVNKRKREDVSDSESDEIAPGRQTLPVANLPYDFDQEPQDGMQYLFLVRRDARRLPHVTRVRNPYEVSETKITPTMDPLSTNNVNVLPRKEWRTAFQTHFFNLRKNLTQVTVHVGRDRPKSIGRVIPEKKDRDAWWRFLTGHPESTWHPKEQYVRKKLNMTRRMQAFAGLAGTVHSQDPAAVPEVQSGIEVSHFQIPCPDIPRDMPPQPNFLVHLQTADSTDSVSLAAGHSISSEEVGEEHVKHLSPPEVTPSHLQEIDHRMSMHLLMYFTHWINVHLQNPGDPFTSISVSHGRWIFALLTKIEDQLSADEMNLLRNLARACLGLIQKYRSRHAKDSAVPAGTSGPILVENATNMSEASCWMIFAAVAGHWSQRDLWADAETGLSSC